MISILPSVATTTHAPSDIEASLAATGSAQANLHAQAEATVRAEFGRKVFIRGVVEMSNFCRQNCHYCGMQRDHRNLSRYRIPLEVLEDLLLNHCPTYVTDINIQAGEDPKGVREIALPLIKTLRANTKLGISVGLGTLDEKLCDELHVAGASFYIIKFETANPQLYKTLEAPGTLEARLNTIRRLAATGWHVSSGFIAGLPGETAADLKDALQLISELPLVGCSVSPFIPGCSTPLANSAPGNLEVALNCLALLRLRNPDRIVPAVSAFGHGDLSGYIRALRAGANLTTVNLTPDEWSAKYPIYNSKRWIMNEDRLLRAIETADREPSTTSLHRHLNQYFPRT